MSARRRGDPFDKGCRRCERLGEYLDTTRLRYPQYFARPVPSFGAARPRLLVVGLAPGLHGANATGRPFTGDHAGILLYRTLYEYGFCTAPRSRSADDGLRLVDCRITNAVRCVPPGNKPTGAEVRNCNDYLVHELAGLCNGGVILTLGGVAHKACVAALGLRQSDLPFGHGSCYWLPKGHHLISSYHCSRYNTQTRRLTEPMFRAVFTQVRQRLGDAT